MSPQFTLHVNGRKTQVRGDQQTTLLSVLRTQLGLKAAKYACGLEQCGACKVLIDGQAEPSCRRSAMSCTDQKIITLEGLSRMGDHPAQRAFVEEQAAQCGYCTAGFIIATSSLLDREERPDPEEVRSLLSAHICRCGVYHRIRLAVDRALEERYS